MILFPAIDLKDGQCVRLKLGDMARPPSTTPTLPRRRKPSRRQGFEWLHVVDLNGAFKGESVNGAAVEAILKATKNPVQLGGGIRTLDHIEAWLPKASPGSFWAPWPCAIPNWSRRPAGNFPARLLSASTPKAARSRLRAGPRRLRSACIELAKKFEGAGVAAIIYTDIDRDGVLAGINWESTIALADAVSIPVIASGGLASIADIVRMTMPDAAKLEGAISGRALYDGRIDPAEALAILRGTAKPEAPLFEDSR
jgi:phosphoribosylformimino-5-aminoimidazole carboxamide ribotide isomerase